MIAFALFSQIPEILQSSLIGALLISFGVAMIVTTT
jgi:hypothetical protein